MLISTLPANTPRAVFEQWRQHFWSAVLRHDYSALSRGLSVDYILVLLTVDRALRAFMNDQLWTDLAWAKDADQRLRREVGAMQWRADAARIDLSYALGEVCLVVGAGVSMAAGLPDWKNLVLQCLELAEDSSHGAIQQDVRRVRSNLLSMQQYDARTLTEATNAFASAAGVEANRWLRKVLMRYFPSDSEKTGVPNSALHDVLSWLQTSRRPQVVWPGITAVVTYNFDDLLELHYGRRSRNTAVHMSIEGSWKTGNYSGFAAGDWFPAPAESDPALHIYHPHGFVPFYGYQGYESIDCVFSERAYAEHYGNSLSFAKKVAKGVYEGTICVFIGTSFTDDRILAELASAFAAHPGWYHYAVMKDESAMFDDDAYVAASAALLEIGVRPVWVAGYEDLPRFLLEMHGTSNSRRLLNWDRAWTIMRGLPAPDPSRPLPPPGARID
jgi:hypothetical protein